MEIKYDKYHIGTKLRNIPELNKFENNILKLLKKEGYETSQAAEALEKMSDMLIPRVSTIGVKDDIKVQINSIAGALNLVSESPDNVFKEFREIISSLNDSADYDLETIVDFHEIIVNLIVKVNRDIKDIFKENAQIKSKGLKDLGHGDIHTVALRFMSQSGNNNITEIIIEPNPTNPKKSLYVKLLYRSQDRDSLESFDKEKENIIEDILKSVGVKDE